MHGLNRLLKPDSLNLVVEMGKKRLSAVLAGAGGNMRGAHIPRILRDRSVDVVSIVDPNERAVSAAQERLGYEAVSLKDWRKAIQETPSDIVIVSTPHDQHFAQVKTFLQDGRHVLIEKPMVTTVAHANTLIKLAKEKGLALFVAYQRHWMREYVYARELISKGKLGAIRGVVGYVTQDWTGLGGWRMDPVQSGGGMFMDTGSHLVASTLWVTNLTVRSASASADKAKQRVDLNMGVQVKFKNGAVGTFATIGNAASHDEQLTIVGEKGILNLQLRGWRVRSFTLDGVPVDIPARIQHSTPDAAFFSAIRASKRKKEYPDFAVEVARLSTAAYRSLES